MLAVGCSAHTAEAMAFDNTLKTLAFGPSSDIKVGIIIEEIHGDDITPLIFSIFIQRTRLLSLGCCAGCL
jgi:hypothetical protein